MNYNKESFEKLKQLLPLLRHELKKATPEKRREIEEKLMVAAAKFKDLAQPNTVQECSGQDYLDER